MGEWLSRRRFTALDQVWIITGGELLGYGHWLAALVVMLVGSSVALHFENQL